MTATREAREAAMQFLYGMDMTGENQAQVPALDSDVSEEVLQADDTFEPEFVGEEIGPEDRALVDVVLEKFPEYQKDIDKAISDNSHKWKIDRISKVDLAILRLAIFEIECLHTPAKIAINEAIEISKKYSGDKSYKFVNGVLAGYTNASKK